MRDNFHVSSFLRCDTPPYSFSQHDTTSALASSLTFKTTADCGESSFPPLGTMLLEVTGLVTLEALGLQPVTTLWFYPISSTLTYSSWDIQSFVVLLTCVVLTSCLIFVGNMSVMCFLTRRNTKKTALYLNFLLKKWF